ncbi:mechanosensitive ion channel family protein [Microbacterium sp. NPDC057650]|uniref:mechanosensitive ion channel family protein n=1 Tax=unclassified Microbacterium TaxID=2609290 RepID=UPI00366B81DD
MLLLPLAAATPAPTASTDPAPWSGEAILGVLTAIGAKLLHIAIIVAVCIAIAFVLRLVIRRVVHRIVDNAKNKAAVTDTVALERSPLADMRLVQRTRTLGTILQNIVNVTLVIVALVLIVSAINPDILGSLTLLTAAVGAGLGFGAQNIVKDVLNGMFIVAEDQIGIGDVVDLGLATGVVEYVSVRITQVRDVNGTLWYVRNGEVTRIGNMSQGWARVIVDLGLPADSDLDDVEQSMLETAQALAKDPKWRTRIIEKPEIWGLESIDGDALVVRVVIKTRANAKDDVAQELRARLKKTFDEKQIALPSLVGVVPTGLDGARRVRGANPPKTRPTPVTGVPVVDRGVWRRKKSGDTKPESGAEGGTKK